MYKTDMRHDICLLLFVYCCIFLGCLIVTKMKLTKHRTGGQCDYQVSVARCQLMMRLLLVFEFLSLCMHFVAESANTWIAGGKFVLTLVILAICYMLQRVPTIFNSNRMLWIKMAYIIFSILFYGFYCGAAIKTDTKAIYGRYVNRYANIGPLTGVDKPSRIAAGASMPVMGGKSPIKPIAGRSAPIVPPAGISPKPQSPVIVKNRSAIRRQVLSDIRAGRKGRKKKSRKAKKKKGKSA